MSVYLHISAWQPCSSPLALSDAQLEACAGGSQAADALEDANPAYLWLWELRDLRELPKKLRKEATAQKKRLKQVRATATTTHDTGSSPP